MAKLASAPAIRQGTEKDEKMGIILFGFSAFLVGVFAGYNIRNRTRNDIILCSIAIINFVISLINYFN